LLLVTLLVTLDSCLTHARGAHVKRLEEAPERIVGGLAVVGIDLHRRRSVLVRMTEAGERLETVRIFNNPASAGDGPRR
jgi:hypothetical protein